MSPQQFRLPPSTAGYEIRFRMTLKEGTRERRLVSVNTVHVSATPFAGSYNLHIENEGTRAASVTATVRFRVADTPS